MLRLVKWLVPLSTIGGIVLALPPLEHWWTMRRTPMFRVAKVQKGELVSVVNATGTVTPVLSVRVGSMVSGPVTKVCVDYNTKVKKDALLAEIDPTIYRAVRDRDAAMLASAQADISRINAQLQQALQDEERGRVMRDKRSISAEELLKLRTNTQMLQAQLAMAQSQVKQAEANLRNSERNLAYTEIRSPVEGVIIDKKIEEGQTMVAQFMAPDLFLVAKDLEQEIHIHTSIDEADVEQVRKAQKNNNPVHFTIDASPEELFEGKVYQIRLNPTTKENVVTYNVVVTTVNPYMKLLPGMTAKLSIQVERRKNVVKVPNAALRFYPKVENVHEDDKKLLEVAEEAEATEDGDDKTTDSRSATQRAADRQDSKLRHVWYADHTGRLRAIAITTGISDYKYTEVISGDLQVGQELVTGTKK